VSFQQIRDRAGRVRGIPLQAVLLAAGAVQDQHDKAKWHTAQGVIAVTGPKFMNWSRGVGGGGAIDLAIHLCNMGFKDAVEWLWRRFPDRRIPEQARMSTKPSLSLPPPDAGELSRVKHYLVAARAIPPAVVEPLIESGRLYADSRANAVFVLLGNRSTPVGAELRATGQRPWRGMAPGSSKDLGFFDVRPAEAEGILKDSPAGVILCESAIDALSCFAIHPRHRCISTAGARPNPCWLASLIQQGHQVHCGFDADPTGENMARAMIALHPTVQRLRPSVHDWNDVLRAAA
jgi:hypothetical protein